MPVVGNRKVADIGRGYMNDPISTYAATFRDLAKNILNESGTDLFSEPSKALLLQGSNETMRNFFVENSADPKGMTAAEYEDHIAMMNEQYLNDRDAILEYAPIGGFNPVIGMTFPIHKNILMNNIFDKGAIQKVVATSPKFTISMETRLLITPDGKEIDMFKEQDKMTAAIDATVPVKEIELALPEVGETDILTAIDAASTDNLSIETRISAIKVVDEYDVGDELPDGTTATADNNTVDRWIPVNHLKFAPNYGGLERVFVESVHFVDKDGQEQEDIISGAMNKNKVQISAMKGLVKAVKLSARKDASNAMLQTCSVAWRVKTDIVEIPSAIPINTPISPEEVKDIGALYQVNQLSKIMSLFKTTLENYKDDKIKQNLDESFAMLPESQKIQSTFDFAPRSGYALDHVEWRHKTFFDYLDTHVTIMLQVLNDPNMTITVFGRPDLIRKITPTEYTYQTPSNIGPVELDFVKTVVTSDKRTYQFISSQKLKGSDTLIVILSPRNTDRIIYRIYDYQMYVSNEIRNVQNYALPAIHAFERWKFVEYQPVQGRLTILNPTGLSQ
jgi:hypothetical protein